MPKKYIISNCPAMDDQARCMAGHIITCNYLKECEFINNCLLKRIVNEIKKEKIINCIIDGKEQILRANYRTPEGNKILELLEIEECE